MLTLRQKKERKILKKLQIVQKGTHSRADSFAPRSTQIGQIAATNQMSVVKSRAVQHLHNISPSDHMLTGQNLQQSRLPCTTFVPNEEKRGEKKKKKFFIFSLLYPSLEIGFSRNKQSSIKEIWLPDPLAPTRRHRDPGEMLRLNSEKSGGCPSYENCSPYTLILLELSSLRSSSSPSLGFDFSPSAIFGAASKIPIPRRADRLLSGDFMYVFVNQS